MWTFLFKFAGFFVLAIVIAICMSTQGYGDTEKTSSDFVKFVPWAASFFIVFFLPSILKKALK